MRSGIELGSKTRLIDMHDVEANQTLPHTHTHTHIFSASGFFVRRVLARKMFHPGENNCSVGMERWRGGIGGNARRRTCYDGEISSLVSEDLGEVGYGLDRVGFP